LSGATASDPESDSLTLLWTVDPPGCSLSDSSVLNPNLTCNDNGSYTATLSADDGTNPPVTSNATVNVANVAPVVESIVSPMAPMAIADQLVDVTATFSDPAAIFDESYTCTVNFGDNIGDQPGTVDGTTCTGPVHVYSAPGVYSVSVTVTDKDSGSGSATANDLVVIYDPAGGFITGGGWIDSPAGAYTADESLSGKASFGFVAKYKKGTNVPDGNTQFQFQAGDLNFHSTSYEWLVVAGNKAQFRGEGTINGEPGYTFKISADDDDPDTFRIQIWGDTGTVYDNGSKQSLGGGSIKVHKG
jgi:PKD repeat protein